MKETFEFKPHKPNAIYGVRSEKGSYRAVVFELPEWYEGCDYMHRYTVDVIASGKSVGSYRGTNDLANAKEMARSAVHTLISARYF